jgi:hypothetical protein
MSEDINEENLDDLVEEWNEWLRKNVRAKVK